MLVPPSPRPRSPWGATLTSPALPPQITVATVVSGVLLGYSLARRSGGKKGGKCRNTKELSAAPAAKAEWAGWSYEEAAAHSLAGAAAAAERIPAEVLADLQRGNARFWTGERHHHPPPHPSLILHVTTLRSPSFYSRFGWYGRAGRRGLLHVAGSTTKPELSTQERRAMILRQYPSTAILSCADSRVPPEIIFDKVTRTTTCIDTPLHAI